MSAERSRLETQKIPSQEKTVMQWLGAWVQENPGIQEALTPEYALPLLQQLGEKSAWTYLHSIRVGLIVDGLAEATKLPQEEKLVVRRAAYLHDVGKLVVPTDILNKKGRLTDNEFSQLQEHSRAGFVLVADNDERVAKVLVGHHEYQGERSYPRKPIEHTVWVHPDRRTQESAIVLMQKIVAVADVVDALSARRPYSKWSQHEDHGENASSTNAWFDAQIMTELKTQFAEDFGPKFLKQAVRMGKSVNSIPEIHAAQSQIEQSSY